MGELPAGTVTLLFTDIDHSTQLVKRLQHDYGRVLAEHRDLLRFAFAEVGGVEVDTQGDAFFVAFQRARDGVAAAVAAQRALHAHDWSEGGRVTVRMGLHTGEPYATDHGYAGLAVHRAARLCTLAHGEQVLLSRATAGIVDDDELAGIATRDIGEYRLKDFDRPERVFQLVVEGLRSQFPPLRGVEQQPPLRGTVSVVMVEGRRMLGLHRQMTPDGFGALLVEYRRLLSDVLERAGSDYVESDADTVAASFATPIEAVHAAVSVQRAVAAHEWPEARRIEVSIGIHSGDAGVGWIGPAALLCTELCDVAEAGEIFISQATAALLEGAQLGELRVHDRGEPRTRRGGQAVRAYEIQFSGR